MVKDYKHLELVEQDITGGKISRYTISKIASSDATELTISGLRQDTFEYLINNFGNRFNKINFWKCPRVEDLSPLASLSKIKAIDWFWNQKSEALWDFSKNTSLISLHLRDFENVKTISELSKSTSLEEIDLNGGLWRKNEIDSLEPLSKIKTLKSLSFSSNLIDKRVEPITRMMCLEEVYFPTNIFTTEQIAWLTSKIGGRVKSDVLAPFRDLGEGLYKNSKGENIDTLVIGKRKPFLDSKKSSEKLNKYINNFNELVKFFKDNPTVGEPL